jgi:hypothetical protein
MNSRSMNSFFAALAAMTLCCGSRNAQAVEMSVQVVHPSQVGNTARVSLGHLVTARSIMISVTAGGTFRVTCPSPDTGTIEGQNAVAQTDLPPNELSVEVPAGWLPAERVLPGFSSLPGDTTLTCAYFWTATAREAMYTLGAAGTGIPIGGDARTRADTDVFVMYQPPDPTNGCTR